MSKELRLTHFGRRSGKPYEIRVWYAMIEGEIWVGSLDRERNWVKNARAGGHVRLDLGDGAADYRAEWQDEPQCIERFRAAIGAKYPLLSRLMRIFSRGKQPAVFRMTPQ